MKSINLSREQEGLSKIILECKQLDLTKKYLDLSAEDLSKLYDRVDGGLISYGYILEKGSEVFKRFYNSKEREFAHYLESRLLTIVSISTSKNSTKKGPSKLSPEQFINSLWHEKLKERQYYEKIFQITALHASYKDPIYGILLKQEELKLV